tara:strand:+ start:997 stop:1938 length:942 start_codon:yes stop_codon:yes gene_type:complete
MKSSQYIDIIGEQVAMRTLYLVVGAVLLVVGGAVGLLYYFSMAGSAPIVAIPVAPTAMVAESEVSYRGNQRTGRVSPQSSLLALLEEHLEVTQLRGVDSLIVNGTAKAAAKTVDLIVMARRPNLYTLKTEDGGELAFQFGYNGEQGWFKTDFLNLNRDKVEFFMRVALFESSLAHLAWSYHAHESLDYRLESVLERLPDEQWQGRGCAVVVSRGLLPFPIYHYIDQQSYEEVYRRTQVLRGTDLVDLEIHFAPSEAAASPRLPMGYELYFDGTLHDTIAFTEIRSNRVVFESLFDAPSGATATSLSPRRARAN